MRATVSGTRLLKAFLGLILCNFLWAMTPSIAKVAMTDVGAEVTAWFRYAGALSALIVFKFVFARSEVIPGEPVFRFAKTTEGRWIQWAMALTACFVSPLAQMSGLQASTTISNSILVSFEPLVTVLSAWLILRQRPAIKHLVGLGVALMGFALLSPRAAPAAVRTGDLLLLLAVTCEGVYSALGSKLGQLDPEAGRAVSYYRGSLLYGVLMLTGVVFLGLPVWAGLTGVERLSPWTLLTQASLQAWIALLWIAIMSTALTYVYWLKLVEQGMPIALMAITLFVQPLFGSALGVWLWNEHLEPLQWGGAGLILFGVLISATPWFFGKRSVRVHT